LLHNLTFLDRPFSRVCLCLFRESGRCQTGQRAMYRPRNWRQAHSCRLFNYSTTSYSYPRHIHGKTNHV